MIRHGPSRQAYKHTLTTETILRAQGTWSRAIPEDRPFWECPGFAQYRPTELALSYTENNSGTWGDKAWAHPGYDSGLTECICTKHLLVQKTVVIVIIYR